MCIISAVGHTAASVGAVHSSLRRRLCFLLFSSPASPVATPAAAPAEDALQSCKFYSAVQDIITSASDEEMESLTKWKIRELLVARGFAEDNVAAANDDIAALCNYFFATRTLNIP